jgi:Rrf2 family iron-sulfur cluster assembly transcriptional regulator
MRLTTKALHAINAMVDLAHRQDHGPVRLSDVADRERISQSYIELLFSKLRHHSLVDGVRGPGGGYRLAKPLEAISMADIVDAVDSPDPEHDGAPAEHAQPEHHDPATAALWARVEAMVREHLQSVTIADVVTARDKVVPTGEDANLEMPVAFARPAATPAPTDVARHDVAMHP